MKFLYIYLRSLFLFYFVASLFNPVLKAGTNSFSDLIVSGLIFGLLLALLPQLLSFMKIKENNGALFLGGIVLVFAFYFVSHYAFKLFTIAASKQEVQVWKGVGFTIDDQTLALILISVVSAGLSVIMQVLQKK